MSQHTEKIKKPSLRRSRQAIQLDHIVDFIILDTGISKAGVSRVLNSFFNQFRRCISEKDVYIRGLGLFESYVQKRYYFDINQRRSGKDVFTVKPRVDFRPSDALMRRVTSARKVQIEELKNSED